MPSWRTGRNLGPLPPGCPGLETQNAPKGNPLTWPFNETDYLELRSNLSYLFFCFPSAAILSHFSLKKQCHIHSSASSLFDVNFSITYAEYRFFIPNKPHLKQNGGSTLIYGVIPSMLIAAISQWTKPGNKANYSSFLIIFCGSIWKLAFKNPCCKKPLPASLWEELDVTRRKPDANCSMRKSGDFDFASYSESIPLK